MGKLKGYDRKNHLRHRTTKQQRMINKGIDTAFKGAGAVGKSAAKTQMSRTEQSEWSKTALSKKQTSVAIGIGLVMPVLGLFSIPSVGFSGMFLLVEFFFFALPFFVMVLIFMIFNLISRPTVALEDERTETQPKKVEQPQYNPNPEWMGQVGLVDSCVNAQILAPQFMKQALESAKILQTTTEPGTFFTRYDFCVGRLMELEECKKYGVSVSTTQDLEKYRNMDFREEAVEEIIHRTQEKYQDKIERLKTQKAKQNWATKYHQAFEPYLPYMSDTAKSKLGESSAELFALAEKKDDTAESVR